MSAQVVATLLHRPIAYHPVFRYVGGSTVAGILLSQMYYWSTEGRISADRGGWFYKTQGEWESETGLSRSEQDRARRDLRKAGFLDEVRKGNPARLWFCLDVEAVHSAISQYAESCKPSENNSMQNPAIKNAESRNQECRIPQSELQKPADKIAGSCNLSVQRLHTENTSENTNTVDDVAASPVADADEPSSTAAADQHSNVSLIDSHITPDQPANQHRERFAMHWDWQPGKEFDKRCQKQMINLALFDEEKEQILGEFRSYWGDRPRDKNSHGQWEHKLAQRLKQLQAKNIARDKPLSSANPQVKRAAVSAAVMDVADTDW